MYFNHTTCRACGAGQPQIPTLKVSAAAGPSSVPDALLPVFDLGLQPLANDFVTDTQEQAGFAPLKVLYCPNCTLAQLSVVVRPEILYRNYCYVTSPSQTMKAHFGKLADDIRKEGEFTAITEIGSNDGGLLVEFKNLGFSQVLGIDPASNLCKIATERGIGTICGFFGRDLAVELVKEFGQSKLILARHVFCHVDDWTDFITGLEVMISNDGLVCIEVPYVGDLIDRGEFDTIYHEHLSFLSVGSVLALLSGTSLRLHKIIRYPIHGGAILLMLRHESFDAVPDRSVEQFVRAEETSITLERWVDFANKARDQMLNLKLQVKKLADEGKYVVGLGASAKSTVWINACGFTRREIKFIADETPQKQWKLSPGSGIPIVDEGAILRELPDYVVVFCWNFRDEVLAKNALARSKGVKFIFPVPTVEVI